MAPTTRNENGQERADLAAAALDRGREQLESAKGQLADGAERVAAAVERTAEELDGEGDGAISGFGHSVASLTRQLAGGLRERDIEEFARELSSLARRNPAVFLAGSVALGFGIARFFKAQTPSAAPRASGWDGDGGRVPSDAWHDGQQRYGGTGPEYDAEDGLDLSASGSQWQDNEADRIAGAESPLTSGNQESNAQWPSNSGDEGRGGLDTESPSASSQSDITKGGNP
jgi:hypothetical protein